MPSFRRALSVALLAAVTLLAAAPGSLAETPPPSDTAGQDANAGDGRDLASFGIAPAGPERADQRPYLQYTVAPGTVVYDHIAVLNQDDQPVDLDVYPSEVQTGSEGGLIAPSKGAPLRDSGAWLSTGQSQVTVPAQTPAAGFGYVIVPFTITVPSNAQPGDHVGAIVASLNVRGEATEDSPGLDLEQRVVARVYLTVQGELAPGLEIRSLGARFDRAGLFSDGRAVVSYALVNTGNTRMRVAPHVDIAGPAGWFRRSADAPVVEDLLPGGQVVQDVTVEGVGQLLRLSVAVVAEVSAPPAGGTDPGLAPVTATAGLWAVPWWLVALLVLAAALLGWRRLRGRRVARGDAGGAGRHRDRRPGGSGHSSAGAPQPVGGSDADGGSWPRRT